MQHIDPAICDPQKIVDQLIEAMMRSGATHLHIEPHKAGCRVRVRLNGMLKTVANLSEPIASQVAHRLKGMARMGDHEARVPQDGYFVVHLASDREGRHPASVTFFVSTIPLINGEKIVIVCAPPNESEPAIDDILDDRQIAAYVEALSREQGLILVAGPTGSGKATLLYHGMRMLPRLRGEDIPMATVEWATRGRLDGATRIVVSSPKGVTFDSTMKRLEERGTKAILVGELHDLAAAEEAIRLTTQRRRLILSTLHTQDAPQALQRLLNLGIPGKRIAESVVLVFALRAMRKLCPACKIPVQMPRAALLAAGFADGEIPVSPIMWKPNRQGCDVCVNGFHGSHYICQMMPVTDSVRTALINEVGTALELEQVALREGMKTLRQEALVAALAGHIWLADAEN